MTKEPGFPRQPDFSQLEAVLRRETPERPVLFEFFLNARLYARANNNKPIPSGSTERLLYMANAMAFYGYDHVQAPCPMVFITSRPEMIETRSLNENRLIYDEESFCRFPWPDPDKIDYSSLYNVRGKLPGNMKLMFSGAGFLETVEDLLGYDNMCFMIYDDPELLRAVFHQVAELIVSHYAHALEYDTVGLIMANDDWGFNTQTLLPPDLLRELILPAYKEVVRLSHQKGVPVVLHSCGCLDSVINDIVYDVGFDAWHSFQDNILPVEKAYEKWHKDIAILGGLDVDFLVNESHENIKKRAKAMLELTGCHGYALGSGNSIPEYIPDDHFFAMTSVALE